jgi:hypothetical protein
MADNSRSRETSASPEAVWRIWSDTDTWPDWNPDMKSVSLEGPFASGAAGDMETKSGGHHQVSLQDVGERPRLHPGLRRVPMTKLHFRCEIAPTAGGSRILPGGHPPRRYGLHGRDGEQADRAQLRRHPRGAGHGGGVEAVKYMLLLVRTDEEWETLSDGERDMDAIMRWWGGLAERGVLSGSNQLQPARTATTISWRNGESVITDGPFMETKETSGGFGIIDVPDLDDTIEIARSWPAVGHKVEIRPVAEG